MSELEGGEGDTTGFQLPVKLFQDSDLFDTGGDDSDSDVEGEPAAMATEREMSPDGESSLPRRKGQQRKNTEGKARKKPVKLKKVEVHQIHSDTQRIVRESSVSLPKYEPKKKTIDSFLTKLRSRKPPARNHAANHRENESTLLRSNDVLPDNPNTERPNHKDPSPPPSPGGDTRSSSEGEVPGQSGEHSDDVTIDVRSSSPCHDNEKLKAVADVSEVARTAASIPVKPAAKTPGTAASIPVKPAAKTPGTAASIPVKPATKTLGTAASIPVKPAAKTPGTGQKTITSLFAARALEPSQPEVVAEPPTQDSLPPTLPRLLPKLSSVNDFQMEGEEEEAPKELTGVELFQQRFMKHTTQPQAMKTSKKLDEEGGGEGDGERSMPLVPEEVMTKLMSKPGAVRQHWRSALQQQLSQKRAEERREAEEYRKMYSEEIPEEEEEEEMTDGETTDAETSDEEFVQNEEVANADSDACSDLDEDEGVEGNGSGDEDRGLGSNRVVEQEGDWHAFSDDEDIHLVSRLTRKPRVLDSDDEDNNDSTASSKASSKSTLPPPGIHQDTDQGHREKSRVLSVKWVEEKVRRPSVLADSEEASMGPLVLNESFESEDSGSRGVQDCLLSTEALRERSDLIHEKADNDPAQMNTTQYDSLLVSKSDTANLIPMESGVGASVEGDTSAANLIPMESGVGASVEGDTSAANLLPMESGVGASVEGDMSAANLIPMESGVGASVEGDTSAANLLPMESGVGASVEGDMSAANLLPMESGVSASVEGDTRTQEVDNSLESSLLWDQVLPPAQPRRDNSLELFPPTGMNKIEKTEKKLLDMPTEDSQCTFDPESQWEPAQNQPSISVSQSVQNSLDEETQFLDADGFLCLRKEKKYDSPISAITGALDPSQEHSSSELLDLCSGKFVTQAEPWSGRKRHASDSSSSQGVRELLGLKFVTQAEPWSDRKRHASDSSSSQGVRELLGLKPKPGGVSKLLAAQSGISFNSDETQHPEMSEVIGLCSGVFPSTQAASTFQPGNPSCTQAATTFWSGNPSRSQASKQSAGTSDGMSEGSSDSEGESALLRWAQKQRDSGRPRDVLKPRDGGDSSDSEDEDMPVLARRRRIIKPRPKPTKEERLAEFVESEAELSGEDVGPDEEPFSGPDEYEEEEGGSDVVLSDSELWDQANKAHMKHALADDKADLQEFKERFLKDGDLFEDGMMMKNGFFRTRRFAHVGSEQGSVDLFVDERGGVESGDEMEEASSQLEAQRRKDRLEREEFIRKCRERENTLLEFDEDSQSLLDIIRDTTSHSLMNTPVSSNNEDVPRPSTTGCKRSRCGSFLRHNTAALRKLSSLTAATSSNLGRGFVFQKNEAATTTIDKSTKNNSSSQSTARPLAKKPKLDRSSSTPSGSIFSMLK